MKKLIHTIKTFIKLYRSKHVILITVDSIALYQIYKKRQFNIDINYKGLNQTHINSIIEELYYTKTDDDRFLDRMAFEAEVEKE